MANHVAIALIVIKLLNEQSSYSFFRENEGSSLKMLKTCKKLKFGLILESSFEIIKSDDLNWSECFQTKACLDRPGNFPI